MLSLSHVRTFLAVVAEGGLRPAARALGLSPASVVEHLDRLDASVGAALLHRSRRRVELTAAGARFAPLARALMATADRARAVVADAPLRIAAASNVGVYLLPPLIAAFERQSGKTIEVWVGPNPEAAERLVTGAADLAVTEWWMPRPGYRALVWRDEPLVAIAPPGHPWAELRAVPFEALARERMLGGERATGTATALRAAFGARADALRAVGGHGGTEGVKRAVRAGLGVSVVLAASVVDEAAAGVLTVRPFADARPVKHLPVVLPEGALPTDAAMRFAAQVVGLEPGPGSGHPDDGR